MIKFITALFAIVFISLVAYAQQPLPPKVALFTDLAFDVVASPDGAQMLVKAGTLVTVRARLASGLLLLEHEDKPSGITGNAHVDPNATDLSSPSRVAEANAWAQERDLVAKKAADEERQRKMYEKAYEKALAQAGGKQMRWKVASVLPDGAIVWELKLDEFAWFEYNEKRYNRGTVFKLLTPRTDLVDGSEFVSLILPTKDKFEYASAGNAQKTVSVWREVTKREINQKVAALYLEMQKAP